MSDIEHHIHSVIVSYKRKELTQRTLDSYLATVSIPYSLIIVDNASPPDTIELLNSLEVPIIYLDRNYFPGYATNKGWERMPGQTTLLHRIDNDTGFLPGWCDDVIEVFKDPTVGQYGLLADGGMEWLIAQNIYPPDRRRGWTVGGASIVPRRLYDEGLRYSNKPWTDGGFLEDTQLTLDVWKMGYKRIFSTRPVMEYLGGDYPLYDIEIKKARGLWTG